MRNTKKKKHKILGSNRQLLIGSLHYGTQISSCPGGRPQKITKIITKFSCQFLCIAFVIFVLLFHAYLNVSTILSTNSEIYSEPPTPSNQQCHVHQNINFGTADGVEEGNLQRNPQEIFSRIYMYSTSTYGSTTNILYSWKAVEGGGVE